MLKIKCNKCEEEFEFIPAIIRRREKVKIKVKCFNCGKMIDVELYNEKVVKK